MANREHVALVRRGSGAVKEWRRRANLGTRLDLSKANLSKAGLYGVDLSRANLEEADLSKANLTRAKLTGAAVRGANLFGANLKGAEFDLDLPREANLSEAYLAEAHLANAKLSGVDLSGTILQGADLYRADLRRANLRGADLGAAHLDSANLSGANLHGANLSATTLDYTNLARADLSEANLIGARLLGTHLEQADISGCQVYGISVWNAKLEGTRQSNLVITAPRLPGRFREPIVTVDRLEVAQFIHLLLHNEKIRDVIDTITSKTVLILGRFKPERKLVLDALREELRKHDLVPILFDFDIPADRDVTETVTLLARMARFIVADLTEPSSIPQELQAIVPDLLVPVQPLLQEGFEPWSMFFDLKRKYHWVLDTKRYQTAGDLIAAVDEKVLQPTEAKRQELARH
jgi:uncharacterized protein YjbI with pentapeptide repeats